MPRLGERPAELLDLWRRHPGEHPLRDRSSRRSGTASQEGVTGLREVDGDWLVDDIHPS